MILADDLGYGDTSVYPFVGSNIKTPELEKMAKRGMRWTNFHMAAPTCTPSRISILTGLYPWRLGAAAVFEYGTKGKSNRDDWLVQVPTVAMLFRDANYSTIHSGKWHMGGMRSDDLKLRMGTAERGKVCPHPGPNQMGFENYVSMLDGPGAPRQNQLQMSRRLHSSGGRFLLKNDRRYICSGKILSDCEVHAAVEMMNSSLAKGKPFFAHIWFHAPHGPWEVLPGFDWHYNDSVKLGYAWELEYRSMVSAMDRSIGMLLRSLESMGIERNTLVVFSSDNGPEDGAGTSGGYRERKRSLYEGGIRVPMIFQWIGTISENTETSAFGLSTDLFPTLAEAAGIRLNDKIQIDGISLFGELLRPVKELENVSPDLSLFLDRNDSLASAVERYDKEANERIALWYKDFEGPRMAAAWIHDFKIILDSFNNLIGMFDMSIDPFEQNNLVDQAIVNNRANRAESVIGVHSNFVSNPKSKAYRSDKMVIRAIIDRVQPHLRAFADHGNSAVTLYHHLNRGLNYPKTPSSDQKKTELGRMKRLKLESFQRRFGRGQHHDNSIVSQTSPQVLPEIDAQRMLDAYNCSIAAVCSCNVPFLSGVPPLPFARVLDQSEGIRRCSPLRPDPKVANKLLISQGNMEC